MEKWGRVSNTRKGEKRGSTQKEIWSGPHGIGEGKLTMRAWEQVNWHKPLIMNNGWTSSGNFLEPTLLVMTGEIWQDDQTCDYTGPKPVLWVDPLQNPPYLYSARACEVAVPEYPKVQDLYNTGQQQSI